MLCKTKEMGGLGFRRLEDFNKALSAKQGCRVLKAKYFPRTTLFEAKCPLSASFIWRSNIFAKSVLEGGCVWQVGDGRTIRI